MLQTFLEDDLIGVITTVSATAFEFLPVRILEPVSDPELELVLDSLVLLALIFLPEAGFFF